MGATTDMIFKLYGHDESASKALKGVGKEAETVSGKLKHIGKMGAVGFAAVGAAALAFAEEGVRAAIKVEKQQKQLDIAIKNNTHATKEQAKGANEYLEKLRLTYGVSNEKLIPAYAKLVRSTKDLGESQKLLNLAMNISSGTGKDLGAVTVALSKAYNGNYAGLTRLGVPIDKATLKTKDFNKITGVLAATFNGAAKASTETLSGKMAILHENLEAAKEKIGIALIPILLKLANYVLKNVVPKVQDFVDGLTGVEHKGGKAATAAFKFGEKVRDIIKYLSEHIEIVKTFAGIIATMWVVGKVANVISSINLLIGAYGRLASSASTAAEAEAAAAAGGAATGGGGVGGAVGKGAGFFSKIGGVLKWVPLAAFGGQSDIVKPSDAETHKEDKWTVDHYAKKHPGMSRSQVIAILKKGVDSGFTTIKISPNYSDATRHASGGAVAAGTQIMVGENGPELFTPTSGGSITPHNLVGGSGMSVHIHVAGSVIHEKDLAVTVRDNIAQLMRRRGLNPAILGV